MMFFFAWCVEVEKSKLPMWFLRRPFHPALAPCPYGLGQKIFLLVELADQLHCPEGLPRSLQVIHTYMHAADSMASTTGNMHWQQSSGNRQ